jgi:hypothetical protein
MHMQRACRNADAENQELPVFRHLRGCSRNADAKLQHSRLQRGSMHTEERRRTIGAGNLPISFLESGDDSQAFRLVESRL